VGAWEEIKEHPIVGILCFAAGFGLAVTTLYTTISHRVYLEHYMKINSFEAKIEEQDTTIDTLNSTVKEKEKTITELNKEKNYQSSIINEMRTSVNEMEEKNAKLTASFQARNNEFSSYKKSVVDMKSEWNRERENLEKLVIEAGKQKPENIIDFNGDTAQIKIGKYGMVRLKKDAKNSIDFFHRCSYIDSSFGFREIHVFEMITSDFTVPFGKMAVGGNKLSGKYLLRFKKYNRDIDEMELELRETYN
jgi:hypothetical protein